MTTTTTTPTTLTTDLSDLARLCASLLDYDMPTHQVRRVLWEFVRDELTTEEMRLVMSEAQEQAVFTS